MLNVAFSDTLKADEKIRMLGNKLEITLHEEAGKDLTDMGGYSQLVYEKGKLEGEIRGEIRGEVKGRAQSLLALIKNSGQSLDEAMRLLDLKPEDKLKYQKMLQELQNT